MHPLTNGKIQWSQHNGHRQVCLGLPKQEPGHMEMGGLQFHADVVENKRKIPCFTTPAPDESGRPPPARPKLRTPEEARQRWLNDSRQFAPWQYADHAMVYREGEPEVIPPGLQRTVAQLPSRLDKAGRSCPSVSSPDDSQLVVHVRSHTSHGGGATVHPSRGIAHATAGWHRGSTEVD